MNKTEKWNNIVVGVLTNLLGTGAMFLTTIYLTRSVDPVIYGEFRLAFSFISLLVVLLLFGRDNGIIFYTQKKQSAYELEKIISQETSFAFLTMLGITVLLAFLKKPVIEIIFNNQIKENNYLLSLTMIPLWGAFNMGIAALKAKNLINYSFKLTNLIQRLIRIPFFIFLVFLNPSFISLTLSMILSQVVLLMLISKKLPSFLKIPSFTISDFFLRFNYSLKLGLSAILFVMLGKIDLIMLGNLTNLENVAIYDVCILISFTVIFPYTALVKATEPQMINVTNDSALLRKYYKNMEIAILFGSIITVIILLNSDTILSIFGNDYKVGRNTLLFLSTGFMFINLLASPIEFLNMNGLVNKTLYLLLLTIIINFTLNSILIGNYGIFGAALATIISLLFLKSYSSFLVIKKLKIQLISKYSLFQFGSLIILVTIHLFLESTGKLPTQSTIGKIFYHFVLMSITLLSQVIINPEIKQSTKNLTQYLK